MLRALSRRGLGVLRPSLVGPATSCSFASSATAEADAALLESLAKEVTHETTQTDPTPDLPPAPHAFHLSDRPGDAALVWTRRLGIETIEVVASVNDEELFDDDWDEDEEVVSDGDGGDRENASDGPDLGTASHRFTVQVYYGGKVNHPLYYT